VDAEPYAVSVVHATLSLQLIAQSPSQVSFASTRPLLHVDEQSLSPLGPVAVQPIGQHPSPPTQALIGAKSQIALHAAAEPTNRSFVQACPSSHALGQAPIELVGMRVSQVSPRSSFPLPQRSTPPPVTGPEGRARESSQAVSGAASPRSNIANTEAGGANVQSEFIGGSYGVTVLLFPSIRQKPTSSWRPIG
jgi:hypothetical protein